MGHYVMISVEMASMELDQFVGQNVLKDMQIMEQSAGIILISLAKDVVVQYLI